MNVHGIGLGQCISKYDVEAFGGKIGFTSEFGVGSDFTFTFKFEENSMDTQIKQNEAKYSIKTKNFIFCGNLNAVLCYLNLLPTSITSTNSPALKSSKST